MRYPIRFRREVPEDIAQACDWYESQKTGLGQQFLAELEVTLERIVMGPKHYAPGERDVRSARLNRFPYVVHFRFTGAEVIVFAVLHGGRNPTVWRGRT